MIARSRLVKVSATLGLGVAILGGSLLTPDTSFADNGNAHDKVTICHRTRSDHNPYVVITIDRAGWENGHWRHDNPDDKFVGYGRIHFDKKDCPNLGNTNQGPVQNP